jgi:pimeloyl-ACP methyl ester carboxylesterase
MTTADTFPRETPSDPEGRFLDTPGGRVHVVLDDARPPAAARSNGHATAPRALGHAGEPHALVFIHGIPGNTRDARYLGPALARRGVTCVRLDMPGFGKTARDVLPAAGAVERAAFVRHVMRTLGFTRFAVAGHSIGGAVALACAARFPDDVTALALVSSVGVLRHRGLVMPTTLHKSLAFLAAHAPGAVTAPLAGMLARYYDGRGTKSDSPVDVATVAHHLSIVGALDFVEQRAHARMVRCPVLVTNNDDDPFIGPHIATSLVDALTPSAPLVTHLRAKVGGHHGQKTAASPIADWVAHTLRAL